MLIREHTEAGFDFHSRVTIWRDPVREMTKTKAHGLLYKQLRADSSFSRQGLPEYLVVFRKWATEGDAIVAVEKCKPEDFLGALALARKMGAKTDEQLAQIAEAVQFSLPDWQQYASPVWMDTRETNVLNAKRDPLDEKHICPMPLDITERGIRLWSNPGDVVLSPFMGIGSEGYVALKQGRRFVGVELKESYWRQACRYLQEIERQPSMSFDDLVAAD
jgi:hypothetical protein